MVDPTHQDPTHQDPTHQDIVDKVDDLSRLVARQSATLARLTDAGQRTGPDVPLLVDLHTLRCDALACAATSRTRKDRAAFHAVAAGLERLIVGRGGAVVAPRTGAAFSATTMEATEVVRTPDAALDRTVVELLEPGLEVGGRSVRPARVRVHRHRAEPAEAARPTSAATSSVTSSEPRATR